MGRNSVFLAAQFEAKRRQMQSSFSDGCFSLREILWHTANKSLRFLLLNLRLKGQISSYSQRLIEIAIQCRVLVPNFHCQRLERLGHDPPFGDQERPAFHDFYGSLSNKR